MRLNKKLVKEFQDYDFSLIKEKDIFLVGSARFHDYFVKNESILQIKYKKLVSIASVDGLLNKDMFSEDKWEILQDIAMSKLKDQEAILVLDINGYIGDHTKQEIKFFQNEIHRPIYYLSRLRIS